MKNLMYSTVLMCCILFVGCSKDDPVGSGNATLQISAEIATTTSGKEVLHKLPGTLDFTSGYVWVSEIVFDGTLETGSSVNRTVERFSRIDFETGTALPALDDITIPAGEYTFVNLGVELRDEDAQPAIVMEGTYTRTDASVAPIRFEFNSGEVFEAETSQQVSMSKGQTMLSKIVFDPDVWFSVVPAADLDNADVDMEGTIVISETSNEAIFDLIADRLDMSTESVFE